MYRIFPRPSTGPDPGTRDETRSAQPEESIVCALCRTTITWKSASISVNGRHKHVFLNPAGLVFEVGCFSRATNISGLGELTYEFTWFPGYSWQTVICSCCRSQLGWTYHRDETQMFFGLILDRLAGE